MEIKTLACESLSLFFLFEVAHSSKASMAGCGRFTNIILAASVDRTLAVERI